MAASSVACGSTSDTDFMVCRAGESIACAGPGACRGFQTCRQERKGFDDCVCSDASGPERDSALTPFDAGRDGGSGGYSGVDGGREGGDQDAAAGAAGTIDAGPRCDTPTPEVCNRLDDDCDGRIDEPEEPNSSGIDFTRASSCGTCQNDCGRILGGSIQIIGCNPPGVLDGTKPGTCNWQCVTDFYDLNSDPRDGCEYYCQWNPDGNVTIDSGGPAGCRIDNDCDGQIDEDLNTCDDLGNCGECGKRCAIANATAKCTTTAAPGQQCSSVNTRCEVDQCYPGFYNADLAADNGCEYQCAPTNPPAEACDGVDNDCDGRIDNLDPDLETQDPVVGEACFGGTQGECATAAHQGVMKCISGVPRCCDVASNDIQGPESPYLGLRNRVCDALTGPQVLRPNELDETCNGKDDDCDGTPDDGVCP